MSMRKGEEIVAMLLIAFIVFWSFYIHFNDPDSLTEEPEERYTGIIKIWDYPRLDVGTGSRYSWIQERIREFEKKNPGVYIDFTPLDWESGPEKIEEAIKSNDKPDIVPISFNFPWIDDLEVLNEFLEKEELDDFKFETLKPVTYNENIIGLPFAMTTYTMYLNLDLFNERGVSPPLDGNWTYEEFVEKLEELTFDSDNDGIKDHFGFNSFIEPNYYNLWGIILSDGAEIIDFKKNKYKFYGDSAIKGVQRVVDLKYKYKVTPDNFGSLSEKECWDMFIKDKKIAVYPTGSWAVKVLEDLQNKGEGFNFDIANYPLGDEKLPMALSDGVASFGVFKQEDKKKVETCVKFLKFLSDESSQKTLEELGVFTVKKGIKDMYKDNPKMKRIEETLYYTQVVPRDENWKSIDIILQDEIKKAVLNKKTSKEAIEEAKRRVENLTR